ncbi:hypothetical protein [Ktedonospora formicarum]|uniref:Uncharacterized protein n=1 Tax=Ktedonospora formicarum TaxID=2778364 RepID=A0A8J3MQG6_9CHLR|nr:hypothetical protein [Ktedonospora formicarum]GHO44892.1 hypothetical protein KSX_30550 [Ktedonospora formicarum]
MDALKERKNRYFILSAGGALVAFLSFLLFAFANLDLKAAEDGVVFNMSLPINATLLSAQSGAIWLSELLALAAIIVCGLIIYRTHPFGRQIPEDTQIKWALYGLIGAGVLALLIQYLCVSGLASGLKSNPVIWNTIFPNTSNANSFLEMANDPKMNVSASYAIGSWLFLLGMLIVIGGAVLEIVQRSPKAIQTQVPYGQGYPANPYDQGQPAYPPQYPQGSSGQYPSQVPPTQEAPTGYGNNYPQYPTMPQQPFPTAPQQSGQQYPSYPEQQPPAGYP